MRKDEIESSEKPSRDRRVFAADVKSIPGNAGRIAQALVNVRGGMRVFAVYFSHSEGWTPRD